jgi:hypothetical protein
MPQGFEMTPLMLSRPRVFAPRFLQTPPRSDAPALRYHFTSKLSNMHGVQRENATAVRSGVHGCGGGSEPPTFGLCDLTQLSMRVGLYLHPRGMLAIQSLRLPPPFRRLGSVLPYRSRDVGSTDFDE